MSASGIDGIDHRREAAFRHQREDVRKLAAAAEVAAVDGHVLAEELDHVERHLLAGVGAAGDEAAVEADRVDALAQHVTTHALDHQVDPAPLGEPERFLPDALARVVDRRGGAEVARLFQLRGGARARDHPRAVQERDLDRR